MMLTRRLFVAAVLALSAVAASARASDFRVDNAVYIEGQVQPQSHGSTIFHKGLVYDFLADPAEIIVFDKARGRFMLLDPTRRVQSEMTIEFVKASVDHVKKALTGQDDPRLRWLGAPTFDETVDRQGGRLTLRNEWMTYDVQLLATGPNVATQYREFSDWYTQFNHLLNPESRPPFVRMKLNEALERNHGIAKEVRLTTSFDRSSKPATIISRHTLAAQLDASDASRIAEAENAIKSFQNVSLQEYVLKK
jgi:hypothetical protein